MDKQINELPPLTELTDDTIFHVKEGIIDKYATREVVSLGIAEDILVDASTTVKGIVQLNNTTSSTSVTEAATANAIKLVADQLAGKLSSAVQVVAGNGLTGGGALTSDVTLTLGTPTTLSTSSTNISSATSHSHAVIFPVTSVAGKSGGAVTLVANDISNATTVGKSFLTKANPSAITFARVNADNTVDFLSASDFRAAIGAGSAVGGSVTSVGVEVPTGFTVTNSPITDAGVIEIGFDTGYSLPTIADQTQWDLAFDQSLRWNGGSTGLNATTGRASLGATTVGSSFFTSSNPSEITYPRVNADNTVTYLTGAELSAELGTSGGSVTSVAIAVPPSMTVMGSPITGAGTITIDFAAGYSVPTDVKQAQWDTGYTERLQWNGGATGLNATTGRTSLGLGTSATINADTTATNNTIAQRTSTGDVAVTRVITSSGVTHGVGVEMTGYALVSIPSAPTSFGRMSWGDIFNHLVSDWGTCRTDGDGIVTWDKTSTPVQRVQLPFGGTSTSAAFQNNSTNGNTIVGVVPNGTATNSAINIYNKNTAADSSILSLNSKTSSVTIESTINGSGTYRPLEIRTGGSLAVTFDTSQNTNLSGDLVVTSGKKIRGDFSNGTLNSRTYLQTSTANSPSQVGILPSGTGTNGVLTTYNSSDPNNTAFGSFGTTTTAVAISSGVAGTGTQLPLQISVAGSTTATFHQNGNTGFGVSSPDSSCRIQSANGIKLGNSLNASTDVLDWYEEGTFTPNIVGTTTAGTATYSVRIGRYQRLGNRVHFQISFEYSGHTGSGFLQLTGLPFAANATSNNYSTHSWHCEFATTSGNRLSTFISSTSSSIGFRQVPPAGGASAINLPLATTLNIITGSYEV